jgi:plasmid stabilization system protein ParE
LKKVVIRPSAAADIESAFAWYEAQEPGLGSQFREQLRLCFALVARQPSLYQIVHKDVRRMLLKRFPYGVYFKEFPEAIVIVACMHSSRNPQRWQARR